MRPKASLNGQHHVFAKRNIPRPSAAETGYPHSMRLQNRRSQHTESASPAVPSFSPTMMNSHSAPSVGANRGHHSKSHAVDLSAMGDDVDLHSAANASPG